MIIPHLSPAPAYAPLNSAGCPNLNLKIKYAAAARIITLGIKYPLKIKLR